MESKKDIRKKIFAERKLHTDEQIEAMSRTITDKVTALPAFKNADRILVYADYNHEVVTEYLIKEAWKAGKEVAVPKVVGKDMVFYKLTDFARLEPGYFGIPEPVSGEIVNWSKALMIMPGVGYEVRGNGEMFPLNGPCWSLFFEYIGNILYALFIRRLSNKALAVLVVMLGMALASFAVFNVSGYGNMGVGWTLDGVNFLGGTLRMLFPFSLGMLMSRNFKPMKVNGAFWICTIILIALFSVPYLEGLEPICMNGIYEAFCVIVVFPFLVWLGASGTTTDKQSTKICKFLGDISYPVYVVHYPLMYLFYAWLIENKLYTLGETWYVAVGVFVLSVILACLCLKLYDEPVRKWLTKKFLAPK